MAAKKKGLSREQAAELYSDLQRSMAKMLKNEAEYLKGQGPGTSAASMGRQTGAAIRRTASAGMSFGSNMMNRAGMNRGTAGALALVVGFAFVKVILSAFEFSGFASVSRVEASYISAPSMPKISTAGPSGQFTKEELQVLTALDSRRAELENRNKRLDEREQDLLKKDKEFALRITQLRELSDKLSSEREKTDRKQGTQLDQLANVYGSMNPLEAAKLMEQLDIVTAMSLISRMPEKRIAQILSAMTPERALEITRMLSGKRP